MRKLYISICESENEIIGDSVAFSCEGTTVKEALLLSKPKTLGEKMTSARLAREAGQLLLKWLEDNAEADYDEPERP